MAISHKTYKHYTDQSNTLRRKCARIINDETWFDRGALPQNEIILLSVCEHICKEWMTKREKPLWLTVDELYKRFQSDVKARADQKARPKQIHPLGDPGFSVFKTTCAELARQRLLSVDYDRTGTAMYGGNYK